MIQPKPEWTHWSDEAASYHKISRENLLCYGATPENVATELNKRLFNLTVYSDGWVVDQSWMIKLFYRAGLPMQFRISPLEMILNEHQMGLWHEIKEQVLKELDLERHRASNDALVIQLTYKRTLAMSAS